MSMKPDYSHYKIAFEYLSESILLADEKGVIQYANPAFCNEFHLNLPDLLDLQANTLICENKNETNLIDARASLERTGYWAGNVWIKRSGAESVLRRVQIDTAYKTSKQENDVFLHILRIDGKGNYLENNAALQELAYHDDLTGLANRALFNQLLKHEITQSQRQDTRFALLFIDLDKFKQVNDSMGHDAGDFLLTTIADRMEKSLRKSDVVARLGGDEFVVIMNNIKESDTVANVAQKVIRQIQKPVTSGAHLLEVSCSVGISIFPENGDTADKILHHADAAMYQAKGQGGGSYFYFSDEFNRELEDTKKLENDIKDALKLKQFIPYFQPLIDHRSGSIVGIECLARWDHPTTGLRSPIEFIPIAKKVGLIHEVLLQVLQQALLSLSEWYKRFQCYVPLSINVTSKQFYQQQTFELLAKLLKDCGLETDAIRIEVTESALQENGKVLVEQLTKVSQAGFSITLDDFGTGFSSLRYLQQLPVDTLKIDRSFVRNIDNNPHDKIIVKAIIQLAHTLGIEAVAEGVETEQQQAFLLDNNCFIMQGHLYSPALPSEQFGDYLAKSFVRK